jgi:hypothetical protein
MSLPKFDAREYDKRRKALLKNAAKNELGASADVEPLSYLRCVGRYRAGISIALAASLATFVFVLCALISDLMLPPPNTFVTTQDGRVIQIQPARVN